MDTDLDQEVIIGYKLKAKCSKITDKIQDNIAFFIEVLYLFWAIYDFWDAIRHNSPYWVCVTIVDISLVFKMR